MLVLKWPRLFNVDKEISPRRVRSRLTCSHVVEIHPRKETRTNDVFDLTIKYTTSRSMLRYIHHVSHFWEHHEQTNKLPGPPVMFASRPFLVRAKL